MKQDFRGLVLQAQGLQCLGERTITTAAEAVIQVNDFTLAVKLDTPAPLTIPLPPPADLPEGAGSVRLRIRDAAGNAATYPITINGSGTLIAGSATLVISSDWGAAELEWTGAEWTPWIGSGGGGGPVTGTGDWTGLSNANTVEKIQHNPVDATALGPGDAGKVLTWDGAKYAATALAALLAAPSVELWIDFGAATDGDGSLWSPFSDPASMTAFVAGQSSAAVYRIHFMGRTGAHVGDAITWPENYLGVFEGEVRGAPTIGAITMSAKDGGQAILLLRNISVSSVTMVDGAGIMSPGTIALLGENSGIDNQIDGSGAPTCTTIWQLSGNIASGFESGGLFNSAYCGGGVDVQVVVLDSVRLSNSVRAATIQAFNCAFSDEITLYDKSSIMSLCSFQNGVVVTFDTVTDAILKLDAATTYKWRNAHGTVSTTGGGSGTVIWYHELGLPCDFADGSQPSIAAGDLGKAYRQDSADQTLTFARADSAEHCQAYYGPWQGDDDSVAHDQPVAYFRLEDSLTVANGDVIYLSRSTPGLYTNTKSATPGEFNLPCGFVWAAADYVADPSGCPVRGVPRVGPTDEVL